MPSLTIELASQAAQTEFNLRRWAELMADSNYSKVEGRVETDRHGRVLMSPPPAPRHSRYQSRIEKLLQALLPQGESMPECAISTADGVRAADVAWASTEFLNTWGDEVCYPKAPEICVEIKSPQDTSREISEKISLYFDAGAKEVWVCDQAGRISFYLAANSAPRGSSALCPGFPAEIKIP